MRDGARDALAGYLYQFLQAAALRAAAMLRISVADAYENADELGCKLTADVERGSLVHEQFGQDAVIRVDEQDPDETVAIQFKYSRAGTRTAMEMADFIEILRSFDASLRAARAE